jgi:hypothetical protein
MDTRPTSLPFAATTGRIVMAWLKAQLDATPSDIEGLHDESGPVPVPGPTSPPVTDSTFIVRLTAAEIGALVNIIDLELGRDEVVRITDWSHLETTLEKLELAS